MCAYNNNLRGSIGRGISVNNNTTSNKNDLRSVVISLTQNPLTPGNTAVYSTSGPNKNQVILYCSENGEANPAAYDLVSHRTQVMSAQQSIGALIDNEPQWLQT